MSSNGRLARGRAGISLVDDTTEMMLISPVRQIIRIDTKQIRAAGRSTSGVKLLNLDERDKVAAAMNIPLNPKPRTAPCYSRTMLQRSMK